MNKSWTSLLLLFLLIPRNLSFIGSIFLNNRAHICKAAEFSFLVSFVSDLGSITSTFLKEVIFLVGLSASLYELKLLGILWNAERIGVAVCISWEWKICTAVYSETAIANTVIKVLILGVIWRYIRHAVNWMIRCDSHVEAFWLWAQQKLIVTNLGS